MRTILGHTEDALGKEGRKVTKFLYRVALCALLPLTAEANTEAFGRLFLTPAQRAALDEARRHKVTDTPKPLVKKPVMARPAKPEPPRPSGNVVLNGIVRRSDGESTIWVNGVAMPSDAQTGKVQVAPVSGQTGVVQVPNSQAGSRVELKVGQKLDMSNGTVTENYANRTPAQSAGTPRPMTERRIARQPRKERPAADTEAQ